MIDVTLSSEISDVGEGGDIDYKTNGESAGDSGEVDRYQCVNCGAHVKDANGETITDCDELYTRLQELDRARTMKLAFSVQGYVTQTIEITNPKYTPQTIEAGLRNGTIVTTIQEDGDVMLVRMLGEENPDDCVIGKVVDVDNQLEYSEFERDIDFG